MSAGPSLSVIVLAWNEEENVVPVLGELTRWLDAHEPGAEVLFVDDGSTDGTARAASEVLSGRHHRILRHGENRGMGAGLKSGVLAARAPYVTFLPADGQIPPASIGTLREAALCTSADVVLSVYARRNDGAVRATLSWGVRRLIRAVHGVTLQSDGPYLFRRDLFVPEDHPSDTFFINFEFPIRALAAGLTVTTVTVECRPRRAGRSKTANARKIAQVARDLGALRLRRTRDAFRRALGL